MSVGLTNGDDAIAMMRRRRCNKWPVFNLTATHNSLEMPKQSRVVCCCCCSLSLGEQLKRWFELQSRGHSFLIFLTRWMECDFERKTQPSGLWLLLSNVVAVVVVWRLQIVEAPLFSTFPPSPLVQPRV